MQHSIQCASAILVIALFNISAFGQFGSTLTGVGAVNRSMGGAATAAPLDSMGAFQWNPATITALPTSMDFGLELMLPHSQLSSRIDAGSLGAGVPASTLSGSSKSDAGVFPLPEFGLVLNDQESAVTVGLGVLTVGGFGVNYPGSTSNPLLMPPLPNGFGVGPIHTQYQLLQVIPTVALKLTDRFSVGFSPIVNLASLSVDPGILAPPDNASGNGFATYPSMNHGAFQWGAGFQLGAYYVADNDWHYGAAFKSSQWFNDFEYNSQDQTGMPRQLAFQLDAPTIVSVGTSYSGFDRSLFAVDARYFGYGNTQGYEAGGFLPTGAVAGLGWKDVFALSSGAQRQITDATSVRIGYSFSTNPIGDDQAFFNIGSPLVIQHGAYLGASHNITPRFKVSIAYAHFFENSTSGLIHGAAGPISGTQVTSHASADSIVVAASVTF